MATTLDARINLMRRKKMVRKKELTNMRFNKKREREDMRCSIHY